MTSPPSRLRPAEHRRSFRAPCAVTLAAALLLVTCPALAIVGSSIEAPSLANSVVMVLQRSGSTAGFCSGVVIGRRAVLTAAHCVPPGADLRVHFREGDRPVLLPVSGAIRHPGYRADAIRTRERSIDLAVVRLAQDLPERFQPASLGTAAGTAVGTTFRVAGFGVTRENAGATSGMLRVATVTARAPVSDLLLWAKGADGNGGACTGDSGGPVLDGAGDTVEAVTLWSAGRGRAQCGDLTQAIWIGPHRDWITRSADGPP